MGFLGGTNYDNPATQYFVWRDKELNVRGCCRLYPTTKPYMLKEAFKHMVTYVPLPESASVWEGSRLCIDRDLPTELRLKILRELAFGYIEYALAKNIISVIGVMYPAIWKTSYISAGWHPIWFGDAHQDNEGKRIRAGGLPVSHEMLANMKRVCGIDRPILTFGEMAISSDSYKTAA